MTEPLDAPFWAAAAEDRLVVQTCRRCGSAWWPAVERCGDCDGGLVQWVDVGLRGTVWSYAIYHRIFDPRLEIEAPYVVAAVELEAGICLPGRLVGSTDGVEVGAEVEASFMEIDGAKAPVWSLVEGGS